MSIKSGSCAITAHISRYKFNSNSGCITTLTQVLWASRTTTAVIGTTVVDELYPLPQTWNITYDTRDRITSFSRSSEQTRFGYSYDANSNRISFSGADIIDIDRNGTFETSDKAQKTDQSLAMATSSNRLLGFAQTSSTQQNGNTSAITTSSVSFALDSVGNITTDGLRTFEYDEANRHSQTRVTEVGGDGEASKITYLHNGLGQRVFKSEPQVAQTAPNEASLGSDFIIWLNLETAVDRFSISRPSHGCGLLYLCCPLLSGCIKLWFSGKTQSKRPVVQ